MTYHEVENWDEKYVKVRLCGKDGNWMTKLPPPAIPLLRPLDKPRWLFILGLVIGFILAITLVWLFLYIGE